MKLQVTIANLILFIREGIFVLQKVKIKKNDPKETMPVRVSKLYYEWLRKEAFEKNDTIKNLTDEILCEFIRNKERDYLV